MFWEMIKQKLTQMWVDKSLFDGIDFNNMNDLNTLAQKIMPWILKSNPDFKEKVRTSTMLSDDQKKILDWY